MSWYAHICGEVLKLLSGIALYLLYREMGLAFLAGLASSMVLVPVNKYIALKIGEMSTKMLQYKDQRMKVSYLGLFRVVVITINLAGYGSNPSDPYSKVEQLGALFRR